MVPIRFSLSTQFCKYVSKLLIKCYDLAFLADLDVHVEILQLLPVLFI